MLFWLIFGVVIAFFSLVFIGLILYGAQDSYWTLFQNSEFRFALEFTLKTTCIATAVAVGTAMPCGYILARYVFPGKVILDTLLDLPLILPPLVSGMALLILFGPILGRNLAKIGINIVFSAWGVIIAQWFVAFPFAVRTFKEGFEAIDLRYEKIARTLGCTPAEVFKRVTLPMARRGIGAGVAMTWARTLGEFGATAMLAGVTRMKTETLSAAIFLNMSIGEIRFALAIAIVLFLTAMLVLTAFKILTRQEKR
ncbi:MAG TPA: ABC transporter [Firmicutes bacterium]|jgi:molybdate transport system permease protein|nr:ABC transporter [Bacillota bacterium]